MIIFNSLDKIDITGPAVVAMGNFDGIHRGHRALIEQAVKDAHSIGAASAVFTFSENPRNILAGHTVVRNIVYPEDKIELIRKLGVDYLFSLPFDEYLMKQMPEDFVKDILIGKLHTVETVCGFNFTYGYKAGGNADTLKAAGEELGFKAQIVPAVMDGGDVISSTLIRQKITEGDVERASKLLGRNYSIKGTVVHGNHIGRTIGFPTCNITVDETMITPANGVYFTYCHVDGERCCSVTNVGNKPTIGTYDKNIETNILDFNRDIYGHTVTIEFLKRRRTERKFSGLDELQQEIDRDKAAARDYHRAKGPVMRS
ncbi:MAG: bifunctional riboflavin kinase/FAD synthetase [Anaerovoracaceae bacterium]|nr:bifunctional riboflavin kinase/FAD synthetase [Bacillota bacterium]MDY2671365.1 bifunctional riboflavin kinase/FAD synthetase [Anaerovoracaceae bacterium]